MGENDACPTIEGPLRWKDRTLRRGTGRPPVGAIRNPAYNVMDV